MALRRRTFLSLAGLAPLMPSAVAGAFQGPGAGRQPHLLQMNGYPTDAETPLDLLTSYLTPNDLFFVRHHWVPRNVDPATWALTVDGEVETPLHLTLADLKRLPASSATCVLQCAGNGRGLYRPALPGVQWKYGAVGNAKWTGVRVADLLQQAGLRASAKHLHTFGADTPPGRVPPFHRSVELDKAMTDAIVAYEMNGTPLGAPHGAPARLIVPGWAGDHWMKWLVQLTAAASPQIGFYMDTAYRYPRTPGAPGAAIPADQMSPVTELSVKSLIATAPDAARVGAAIVVRGIAFSGAPDIRAVDVSVDDGKTWAAAVLDPQHDPYAWRLWSYRWTPQRAGVATVIARATDSRGAVQPREAVWNPSGYLHNGWHGVRVEVRS